YSTRVLLGLVRDAEGTSLVKDERIHWGAAALGGFLTGLITVGLGKLILPYCLRHERCHNPAEAVGTTVAVVFAARLCAFRVRLRTAVRRGLNSEYQTLLSILVFVVSGLFIGGQLGPRVAYRFSLSSLRSVLVGVLYLISGLMFFRFWFDMG